MLSTIYLLGRPLGVAFGLLIGCLAPLALFDDLLCLLDLLLIVSCDVSLMISHFRLLLPVQRPPHPRPLFLSLLVAVVTVAKGFDIGLSVGMIDGFSVGLVVGFDVGNAVGN